MPHSRSPFGAARATLVPALPVGEKNVLIPPLILEPVLKSSAKGANNKQHVNQGVIEKESDTKQLKETLSQIVGAVSGESTPVTSNALSTEKTLMRANQALMDAQQKQKQKATNNDTLAPVPTATNPNNVASSPSSKQHLNNVKENKQPQRSKSTSSLIEQLNRAVALKGEKAVFGLLEKIEKPLFSPPLTPRGRSMDLLSSMGAPLTPRSRPSSPERWNGMAPLEKKSRATPLPKGEKLEIEYIVDAAKIIPNVYETELVNYIVRGPVSSPEFNYDFFSSEESYRETFDVENSESVEILAQIEVDGSVFALVGKDARHGNSTGETQVGEKEQLEWNVYENLEETQRLLGSVTYIDMEGNEREYWLGEIRDLCHIDSLLQ